MDFELEYIKGSTNASEQLSRAFECSATGNTTPHNDLREFVKTEAQRKELIDKWHFETGHGSLDAVNYHICKRYIWK